MQLQCVARARGFDAVLRLLLRVALESRIPEGSCGCNTVGPVGFTVGILWRTGMRKRRVYSDHKFDCGAFRKDKIAEAGWVSYLGPETLANHRSAEMLELICKPDRAQNEREQSFRSPQHSFSKLRSGASRFASVLIPALLCTGTFAQQTGVGIAPVNRFVGTWKLNIEKSSPGQSPTSGTFAIQPEGKKYKITLEAAYRGGFGGTAWTVSDLKGWGSPVTRNFSEELGEQWYVKLEGVDSLDIISVDGAGDRTEWRYTVGPDGKTLTRRVVGGGIPNRRNQVLVFEKVP